MSAHAAPVIAPIVLQHIEETVFLRMVRGTLVRAPHVDLFSLTRADKRLVAHIDGFCGPLTLKRFKGGQSNPTYLLSTPAGQYVMRSKPASVAQLLPSAHAVEREYRVQSALAGSAVPVAREAVAEILRG